MADDKKLIMGAIAAVAVITIILMVIFPFNSLVSKDQSVKNQWSDIEVQVQ